MPIFNFKISKNDVAVIDNQTITIADGNYKVEAVNRDIIITVFKNLNAEPSISGRYYLPLNAVISVRGEVKLLGRLALIKQPNGEYEVKYALQSINEYVSPVAITRESGVYRGMRHTVTLYRDSMFRVMAETDMDVFTKDIIFELIEPKLILQPLNSGELAIISSKTDKGVYLLILLWDKSWRTVFEGLYDRVDFLDDGFCCVTAYKDMVLREKHQKYAFDSVFSPIGTNFVYGRNTAYSASLLPCLFLEAVMAGDIEKAKNCLSSELAPSVDSLLNFIGPFTDFKVVDSKEVPNSFVLENVTSDCGIFDTILLTFDISGGKISNVSNDN